MVTDERAWLSCAGDRQLPMLTLSCNCSALDKEKYESKNNIVIITCIILRSVPVRRYKAGNNRVSISTIVREV